MRGNQLILTRLQDKYLAKFQHFFLKFIPQDPDPKNADPDPHHWFYDNTHVFFGFGGWNHR